MNRSEFCAASLGGWVEGNICVCGSISRNPRENMTRICLSGSSFPVLTLPLLRPWLLVFPLPLSRLCCSSTRQCSLQTRLRHEHGDTRWSTPLRPKPSKPLRPRLGGRLLNQPWPRHAHGRDTPMAGSTGDPFFFINTPFFLSTRSSFCDSTFGRFTDIDLVQFRR